MVGASALQSELNSHTRVNTRHATLLLLQLKINYQMKLKHRQWKTHLQVEKVGALCVMSTCLWRLIFSCPSSPEPTDIYALSGFKNILGTEPISLKKYTFSILLSGYFN